MEALVTRPTEEGRIIRRLIASLAALVAVSIAAPASATDPSCRASCAKRVQIRDAHARWQKLVAGYGRGLLAARVACESLSAGGYALATTGNGYWFAHQFAPSTWVAAGGRMRGGRPVGVWTTQPSRLEQDARAVITDRQSSGDPWPNCP